MQRAPLTAALLLLATAAAAQVVTDPGKPGPGGPATPQQPRQQPGQLPSQLPGQRAAVPDAPGKPAPLPPTAEPRRPGPPGPTTAPQPGGQAASGKPAPLGPITPGEAPANARVVSSGTGFIIGERQAMTNDHVIRDCTAIRARNSEGRDIVVTVRARDQGRDLALLDLRDRAGPPLTFRSDPTVRRGEAIVTYGFPLSGLLSSGPTLTTGDISALAGLSDNQQQYQISAPVQPGNSGGPLLDLAGNVVGIITSKLNAQRVAQRTGDIPQNVNFAVKASEALAFLRAHNVTPRTATTTTMRSPAEVGDAIHASVLFLRCLG